MACLSWWVVVLIAAGVSTVLEIMWWMLRQTPDVRVCISGAEPQAPTFRMIPANSLCIMSVPGSSQDMLNKLSEAWQPKAAEKGVTLLVANRDIRILAAFVPPSPQQLPTSSHSI